MRNSILASFVATELLERQADSSRRLDNHTKALIIGRCPGNPRWAWQL